ncbi:MAG: hypothetical protein DSM106950_11960 [Stigonema ocellatum SAG 48.90 = DSM 106950]|nr:hypothetical protein [Stigonema ocellatum SAG 48.90 = DSM 106950]
MGSGEWGVDSSFPGSSLGMPDQRQSLCYSNILVVVLSPVKPGGRASGYRILWQQPGNEQKPMLS